MVNLFNLKIFAFMMAKGDPEFKSGLLFDYILGPNYHQELKINDDDYDTR